MPHLNMTWPFGPGVNVPNITATIKQVSVQIDSSQISLVLAALDADGQPLDGQYVTVPMPLAVFSQFAQSQTQAMLQALVSLPPAFFAGLGLPDFSTATIVVD